MVVAIKLAIRHNLAIKFMHLVTQWWLSGEAIEPENGPNYNHRSSNYSSSDQSSSAAFLKQIIEMTYISESATISGGLHMLRSYHYRKVRERGC